MALSIQGIMDKFENPDFRKKVMMYGGIGVFLLVFIIIFASKGGGSSLEDDNIPEQVKLEGEDSLVVVTNWADAEQLSDKEVDFLSDGAAMIGKDKFVYIQDGGKLVVNGSTMESDEDFSGISDIMESGNGNYTLSGLFGSYYYENNIISKYDDSISFVVSKMSENDFEGVYFTEKSGNALNIKYSGKLDISGSVQDIASINVSNGETVKLAVFDSELYALLSDTSGDATSLNILKLVNDNFESTSFGIIDSVVSSKVATNGLFLTVEDADKSTRTFFLDFADGGENPIRLKLETFLKDNNVEGRVIANKCDISQSAEKVFYCSVKVEDAEYYDEDYRDVIVKYSSESGSVEIPFLGVTFMIDQISLGDSDNIYILYQRNNTWYKIDNNQGDQE